MEPPVGHDRIVDLLRRTVQEGRPAHAYLFTGREGVGKKLVALRFACLLNCLDPAADRTGTCPACRRILAGGHPDCTIEKPERGMIRIERIRRLQGFFKYAPVEGRYRVAIIDDAHLMNRQAQNALLKTLEEPPPGRVLILVTSKPFLLLSTVRSRCRRTRFAALPFEALQHLLIERFGISPEQAAALAAMSGGSVARALEIKSTNFLDLRDRVIAAVTEPESLGIAGLLEFSLSVSSDRKKVKDAIEMGMTWVRDLLVAQVRSDPATLIHRDLLDRIFATAQHHSSKQLTLVYDELLRASQLVEAETNFNANLTMDVMVLRIARILAGPTLGVSSAC